VLLDVGGNTARASAVFVSTSTLAGVYRDDEIVTNGAYGAEADSDI
jgi:hypothetical protein